MKNFLSFLFALIALNVVAQNQELVDHLSTNQYTNRSYIYTGSVTLTPNNGGFHVNAGQHGPFFIRPAEAIKVPQNIPPTLTENFVRVEGILINGVTHEDQISGLNHSQRAVSFDYSDGSGRPIQSVGMKGSPSAKDVVQFYVYDNNTGRAPITYLPFVSNDDNGGLKSAPLSNQTSFYSGTYGVATDARPFQELDYELSPLNRVKQAYGSGQRWKNEVVQKSSQTLHQINAANTVRRWYISSSTDLPESSNSYQEGALWCTTQISEEGYTIKTYTDLTGNVVMTDNNGLQTYYVYDIQSRLRYVLPPLLTKQYPSNGSFAQPNQTSLNLLAFQYKYDRHHRLIEEKGPGADNDWVYYVYDQWDRLVAKQDGAQRIKSPKEWSFIKYDGLNRVVMTGILKTSISSRNDMAATVSGAHAEARTDSSPLAYSTTNTFPTTSISGISSVDVLTIKYYDDYAFRTINGWSDNNAAYAPDAGLSYSTAVKGMVTGTKVKMLDENTWLTSVQYYDDKYRPVQTIQRTYFSNTPDRITNIYNAESRITQTERKHYNPNTASTVVVTEEYAYDHAGRLKHLYHRIGNNPRVLLASYNYNELGQLIEKNLHSTDNGSSYLQSVDYRYNIRGWLTSINNASLSNDGGATNNDTNDLFGMNITYNEQQLMVEGENSPLLYDGRISSVRWSSKHPKLPVKERIYTYNYDNQLRFTKANYAAKAGSAYTDEAGMYHTHVSQYDENGNIKKLQRNAKVNGSKQSIDDLTYGYAGDANQLTTVEDAAPYSQFGYPHHTSGLNPEMEYDKNGNLKYDLNSQIVNVKYNYLNLPASIELFTPGGKYYVIQYTYDATGYAWKKVLREGGFEGDIRKTVSYAQGIHYYDNVLSIIFTAEGRATPHNGSYEYEYFLKDHLTNTRVVFGQVHETEVYKATMESELASEENPQFENLTNSPRVPLYNRTPASMAVSAPNESVSLNGYNGGAVVGPAKMLTVKAGDKVNMEVFARYTTGTSSNSVVNNLIAAVTGAYGIVNGGETQAAYNAFNTHLPAVNIARANNAPKAYLFYVLFNTSHTNAPQFGYARVEETALIAHQRLALDMQVPYDGYMYIYIANESNISAATAVYFDDFKIIHQKNAASLRVTEVTDYDPLGMIIEGTRYVDETRIANNYKYQGDFSEFDELVGWNRFEGRGNYDSRLGRWHSVDPANQFVSPYIGMGNNPVVHVDPDGRFIQAIFIGALMGAHQADQNGGDWREGALRGALSGFGFMGSSNPLLSMVVAQNMPSISVYESSNFSLSLSPVLSSSGLGAILNANYTDGYWSFGTSISGTGIYGGKFESRLGGAVSYYDSRNKIGGSVGLTRFGGIDPQNNWMIGFRKSKFRFAMTNDAWVGGDKFRTAAGEIGYSDFSFGFNLYSTKPNTDPEAIDYKYTSRIWGENKRNKGAYRIGSPVYSALYFGYRYEGKSYRLGLDAPFVQDLTQNFIHKYIVHSPYFKTRYGDPWRPYLFMRTFDPYSLY